VSEKKDEKGEKYAQVDLDFEAALPALVALGIAKRDVEHFVEQACDIADELIEVLDDEIDSRTKMGKCTHPESVCLAMAILTEKYLTQRLRDSNEKVLDPIAAIEAVRKFVEIEVDEESEATPTVH